MTIAHSSERSVPIDRDEFQTSGVRRSLAYQALGGAFVAQEPSAPKESLTPAESMKRAFQEVHFYAHNTAEEASVNAILREDGTFKKPVVAYLESVSRSLDTKGAQDPMVGPRAIVRQFEDYATDARREAFRARVTMDSIQKRDRSSEDPFREIYSRDEVSTDQLVRRTLISVVRLIEDDVYTKDGEGAYPLASRSGIDSLERRAKDDYIYKVLQAMPIAELLEYCGRVRENEKSRFEYWREQLLQLCEWEPIRPEAAMSASKFHDDPSTRTS